MKSNMCLLLFVLYFEKKVGDTLPPFQKLEGACFPVPHMVIPMKVLPHDHPGFVFTDSQYSLKGDPPRGSLGLPGRLYMRETP